MFNLRSVLFGIFSKIKINLIGQIFITEIISLLSLPFINFKVLFRKNPQLIFISISFILYLFIQIFVDLINNTSEVDCYRGWAMIVFSLISTIYYTYLGSYKKNFFVSLLIGVFFIGLILGETTLTAESDNFFKVRFLPFLNPLVLILSHSFFRKKKYNRTIVLFFVFAFICLLLNARSNGVIFLIAGILIYVKIKNISISFLTLLKASVFCYGIYVIYINNVIDGNIKGSTSKQISLLSNPYNPFELLYYGRIDSAVLLEAIGDKPLLGHGSWAKDEDNKYARIQARLSGKEFLDYHIVGYVRAHSIILGIWAYAGFFGFLIMLIMFFKLYKVFYKIFKQPLIPPLFPVLLIVAVQMLWHLFYSPIGHLRISFPLFASLIIVEYNKINKIK